ncbi:MAG: flagellar hook-length control protein FliK [Zymomonas mobilis subsp. pomaceae]|uniref:flagellar hook-length control protein FliK n=1 Tax=Zymomonas mobilis TaxID=542 RepID=UPI0039E8F251
MTDITPIVASTSPLSSNSVLGGSKKAAKAESQFSDMLNFVQTTSSSKNTVQMAAAYKTVALSMTGKDTSQQNNDVQNTSKITAAALQKTADTMAGKNNTSSLQGKNTPQLKNTKTTNLVNSTSSDEKDEDQEDDASSSSSSEENIPLVKAMPQDSADLLASVGVHVENEEDSETSGASDSWLSAKEDDAAQGAIALVKAANYSAIAAPVISKNNNAASSPVDSLTKDEKILDEDSDSKETVSDTISDTSSGDISSLTAALAASPAILTAVQTIIARQNDTSQNAGTEASASMQAVASSSNIATISNAPIAPSGIIQGASVDNEASKTPTVPFAVSMNAAIGNSATLNTSSSIQNSNPQFLIGNDTVSLGTKNISTSDPKTALTLRSDVDQASISTLTSVLKARADSEGSKQPNNDTGDASSLSTLSQRFSVKNTPSAVSTSATNTEPKSLLTTQSVGNGPSFLQSDSINLTVQPAIAQTLASNLTASSSTSPKDVAAAGGNPPTDQTPVSSEQLTDNSAVATATNSVQSAIAQTSASTLSASSTNSPKDVAAAGGNPPTAQSTVSSAQLPDNSAVATASNVPSEISSTQPSEVVSLTAAVANQLQGNGQLKAATHATSRKSNRDTINARDISVSQSDTRQSTDKTATVQTAALSKTENLSSQNSYIGELNSAVATPALGQGAGNSENAVNIATNGTDLRSASVSTHDNTKVAALSDDSTPKTTLTVDSTAPNISSQSANHSFATDVATATSLNISNNTNKIDNNTMISGGVSDNHDQMAVNNQLDLEHQTIWLDQLTRDIAQASGQNTNLTFNLHPDHLGMLHVSLQSGTDGLAVHMTASSEAAQSIIANARHDLVDEARAQGVQITHTQVDLSSQTMSQGSGQSGQQNQQNTDQRFSQSVPTVNNTLNEKPDDDFAEEHKNRARYA